MASRLLSLVMCELQVCLCIAILSLPSAPQASVAKAEFGWSASFLLNSTFPELSKNETESASPSATALAENTTANNETVRFTTSFATTPSSVSASDATTASTHSTNTSSGTVPTSTVTATRTTTVTEEGTTNTTAISTLTEDPNSVETTPKPDEDGHWEQLIILALLCVAGTILTSTITAGIILVVRRRRQERNRQEANANLIERILKQGANQAAFGRESSQKSEEIPLQNYGIKTEASSLDSFV